ncbi:serine/arginine-rich splicing factor 7-like [Haliotis asinina]|uniref:serine/arginine-rich splicing factor 7-like n=1 Tax=Haliotis asinina TaxID=109174 RepID=UPI003531FA97
MSVYDAACGGYRVFIGALGAATGKGHLIKDLQKYGQVLDLWLARNPPGYAYVVYSKAREAESLVRERNGRMLAGRRVRVEHARPYFSRSATSILPFHLIASRLRRNSKLRSRQRSWSPSNARARGHGIMRSSFKRNSESLRCSSTSSTSRTPSRSETQRRNNSSDKRRKRYKHRCGRKKRNPSRSRSSSRSSSSCWSSSRSRPTSRHRSKRSDTDVSVKYFKCKGRQQNKSQLSPSTKIADISTGIESWTTDEDLPNIELNDAAPSAKKSVNSEITISENTMSQPPPELVSSAVTTSTSADTEGSLHGQESQCHIQSATQKISDKLNEPLFNGSNQNQNETALCRHVPNTTETQPPPKNSFPT